MHRGDGLAFRRIDPVAPGAGLRLGVLTFHRCINYGSYWQARCMVEGLRASGHDAVLLDHRDPRIDRAEWACALQPMLPVRSAAADRKHLMAKVRAFAAAVAQLPLSAPFPLNERPTERFDAIVVGSDEVWNPSHPWYGEAGGLFWGERLDDVRLIAHAASCGGHTAPWPGERAALLRRFESIAVRDVTTQAHVVGTLGTAPPLVLDPCLQFPPPPAPPLDRAPYALVYGHEFPGWAGRAIREWAAARELELLSVGYRNDFADVQWLDAPPAAFASAVAGAAAVITTMFHGSVFALNAGKPLAAIPAPYRFTKLTDLLSLLGAERHLVGEAALLPAALDGPPSPSVYSRIAELRATSDAHMQMALG